MESNEECHCEHFTGLINLFLQSVIRGSTVVVNFVFYSGNKYLPKETMDAMKTYLIL